jgi:hypothetical protein
VAAFHTGTYSRIKAQLKQNGFAYFAQKATYKVISGLREQYIDKYLDNLAREISVPTNKIKEFKNAVEEVQWTDGSLFTVFNTAFDRDHLGNINFITMLFQHDVAAQKYNGLVAYMTTDFKLAPDLLIITKGSVVLGGIYSS